ncbi:hypothetical protein [uncultured Psychroserpens sp.]|uniref:hypothetical protein n=1 Tax=uncultured Psychroserpens sp. TaxID=255436 RepID=UPI0026079441|nr:hypothetical protein [uncultured Psychroserpens sp.]
MAPIKFDETIKDKLEKRTLQPSNDAWNQLSARLDAEDKKSSRSLFFYIGIAASIVGVLFVTTLFFQSSENQSVSPTVVDTDVEMIPKNKVSIPVDDNTKVANSNEKEIITNQEMTEKKSPVTSSIKNELQVATVSEEEKVKDINKNEALPGFETQESVATIDRPSIEKKEVSPLNTLTFEQVKVNEVVAEIKKLEADGNIVTDAEIEDLLKAAEKDILRQRIYNETTRTVDADALLQDVEEDLEQSFRTKVFESLKSNFKTVKTAVAERNN